MVERFETVEQTCRSLRIMTFGLILMTLSALPALPKLLVWNASESVPTGLYFVSNRAPQRGDLVFAKLPKAAWKIADQRGYLPPNIPAIKRVLALESDRVCRFGRRVSINGKAVATALLRDRNGLKLPVWIGCRTLISDDVFLLADHPQSFDGRYFGVTRLNDVLGVALPVRISTD